LAVSHWQGFILITIKQVGVDRVIATNAVGSLREELSPRTLVIPDQIFDRTKHRDSTYFDNGMAVHIGFANPYDPALVDHLATAGMNSETSARVIKGGTYVCIEGPQFSTKAESEFYRTQGHDIIGMTAIPEAKLAREAQLSYAAITGITDYDVWKENNEVTLGEVLENAAVNQDAINSVLEEAIRKMPEDFESEAWSALEGTINTPIGSIPEDTSERLELLVDEYL
jgi:5'-methylthioadenosine phosphorylase